MNYKNSLLFLTSISIIFSILGGTIGYIIGSKFPAYYRSVFYNGHRPDFDPVSVGVGQGTGQGFVGGAIIGVIVIFILTKRKINQDEKPEQ